MSNMADGDVTTLSTSDVGLLTTMETIQRETYTFPESTHLVVGSYLLIIGILGTLGNGVVLAMFLRFRFFLTPTTSLLLNLAIADLGLCLFGFPFSSSSSFAKRWKYGDGGCQAYAFMGFLFGSAHIATLAFLGLDRYLVICRITIRNKLTYKRYCYFIIIIWVYAFFWAIMPLFGWGRYNLEPSSTTCTIDWRHNDGSYKSFLLVYFVFGYIVPSVLLIVCYSAAIRQIRVKTRCNFRPSACEQWADEKNITLMCVILVAAFVVSWTPYSVLCLWTVFSDPSTVPPVLTLLPPLFAKASTVLNPIIYFATNNRLRSGMKSAILCCRNSPQEAVELACSPERIAVDIEQ